jgi:hypothetical protein
LHGVTQIHRLQALGREHLGARQRDEAIGQRQRAFGKGLDLLRGLLSRR